MRVGLVWIVVAGCGGATPPGGSSAVSRLRPPDALDLRAPGAEYLTSVAMQLQPGWGQFLADCRLRLPAGHPLNAMTLAATAELVVDASGRVVESRLSTPSGNADFDRAVTDVIADSRTLAAPPPDLLADDDRVHLRWLFARDRRQAGPATAKLVPMSLPLDAVIPRLVARGELARAARRIAAAPAGSARASATTRVMVAALGEAIASPGGATRNETLDAITRAHVTSLAPQVRVLLAETGEAELRAEAITAVGVLGDTASIPRLVKDLPGDLAEQPAIALAETRALVALGATDAAAAAVATALATTPTSAAALAAFALVPTPDRVAGLAAQFAHADAATRAALCAAFASSDASLVAIGAGLRDADATVRASCADAAHALGKPAARLVPRLVELTRDRDRRVRAHAIAALAVLDPARLPAVGDDAALVRSAYAHALAALPPRSAEPALRALLDDRDPDVRAAAWSSLAALPADAVADRDRLAQRAAEDSAPQVRVAALPALADDDSLARLAGDDAPEVRTAALVRIATRRGRAAMESQLLDRLAAAPPASAERVRIALAWLLAS
jgi:HEAT repeat protein/TonB-like protein